MLSHAKVHESLTGKLLLSSALVVVTVGYGWWQHNAMSSQQAAAIAAMQMPAAPQPQAQAQNMAAAPAPIPAAPPVTMATLSLISSISPPASQGLILSNYSARPTSSPKCDKSRFCMV